MCNLIGRWAEEGEIP
nr:glucuronate isomerase [Citrobacter werkmanii]